MSLDPYQLLGIEPGASRDEIRAAFRRRAQACHPDLNPGDPKALARFKAISAAHQKLIEADGVSNTSCAAGSTKHQTVGRPEYRAPIFQYSDAQPDYRQRPNYTARAKRSGDPIDDMMSDVFADLGRAKATVLNLFKPRTYSEGSR